MVTETKPFVYAIEPQTTNVPAEKKLMKSDNPLIHQGTAPPAAKKLFMFFPELENERPPISMPIEKMIIIM
jgi:hypothetical protein